MPAVTLVFPHQLFENNKAIESSDMIYIVEEFLFFNQYQFHQQKLVLHRVTMRFYQDYLKAKNYQVTYINAKHEYCDVRKLLQSLPKTTIKINDVVDKWLKNRIDDAAQKYGHEVFWFWTPNFLGTMADYDSFFAKGKKYFQTDFYIKQRKRLGILLEEHEKPIGGKWSFDDENREKYPKNKSAPFVAAAINEKYVNEAITYVEEHFPNSYGSTKHFIYPVTHDAAKQWMQLFFAERFKDFGIYEDAIVAKETFLNHSIISPMLNIGLLSPKEVIDAALLYAQKNDIPLNSLEGFVRQIIGWREFIRVVYEKEGSKQRTTNYWKFTRKIPKQFWEGTTGIVPIDDLVAKNKSSGYNHHIERLMIMGNFMLLCEFDPNEVYKWFMEMYVDAYDWVMVPNVYGMTQFADGGLMTTKPYISGSNYIIKMSDYKKGPWSDIWDALFWRFMHVHRSFFLQNPRLGMLVKTFDKMDVTKQELLINTAENYLQQLDNENG